MNREALTELGEYPKHMRLLVFVKELLTIRKYMMKTSDADMMKLPTMTDNSKQFALIFARGLGVQAFYCDDTIEYLVSTIRCLKISYQHGLSAITAMSIIGYGVVRKRVCVVNFFASFIVSQNAYCLPYRPSVN